MADLRLDIESELPAALRWLGTMRGQMPYAVSQALNKTGFDVRRDLSDGTRRYFDNPTSFTTSAFLVEKGNKQDPTVLVGAQRNRPYFTPQIRGGERYPKAYEGFLRGIGAGSITGKLIPTSYVKDGRGNPKKSIFGQVARASTAKRSSYFIGKPKNGNRPSGVYRRSEGKLIPYFIEIREPKYEPRFPMLEIGKATVNRVAGNYLRSELERALASAR
jgi:hypothetical protein